LIEDSPAIELELEVPNVIETVNVVHNDEVQEEEIVVQIDEEENDQKQGTLFNLPGWMRGRR
jgi:hypothetical protein